MLETRTISISVERPWQALYEAIWRPEVFPKWASGLSGSPLQRHQDRWLAAGPEGPVMIRFTDWNPFGIMDHYVDVGRGSEIYIPLRVISNGSGAEVLLTLFRLPEMSDEKFLADIEWVKSDLAALKVMAMGLP